MDGCDGVEVSDVTCKLMGQLISGSDQPKLKKKEEKKRIKKEILKTYFYWCHTGLIKV